MGDYERTGSLRVENLHKDVTEEVLFQKFSQVGPILSVRLCCDGQTKQSLGYGYVNFIYFKDAKRVIETMNFDKLKGKPIHIMWSQRYPELIKSGVGNVFVKNLDQAIDDKIMHETFSAFGTILSCRVVLNEDGHCKGYGFVLFDNEESAKKAIEKGNGMVLKDKKIHVEKFVPKKDREVSINDKKATEIFVKNFGPNMTDDKLVKMFEKFGNITKGVIIKHADGNNKGCGSIVFSDPKSVEAAICKMNGVEVEGNLLKVERFQIHEKTTTELENEFKQFRVGRNNNLYVKNLDDSFDNEKLYKEFAPFGTIISASVAKTENGQSKGFGFVCYSSDTAATKAIEQMNRRIVGTKPLYVALAQKKEERQAYMAKYLGAKAKASYSEKDILSNSPNASILKSLCRSRSHDPVPEENLGTNQNVKQQTVPLNPDCEVFKPSLPSKNNLKSMTTTLGKENEVPIC